MGCNGDCLLLPPPTTTMKIIMLMMMMMTMIMIVTMVVVTTTTILTTMTTTVTATTATTTKTTIMTTCRCYMKAFIRPEGELGGGRGNVGCGGDKTAMTILSAGAVRRHPLGQGGGERREVVGCGGDWIRLLHRPRTTVRPFPPHCLLARSVAKLLARLGYTKGRYGYARYAAVRRLVSLRFVVNGEYVALTSVLVT